MDGIWATVKPLPGNIAPEYSPKTTKPPVAVSTVKQTFAGFTSMNPLLRWGLALGIPLLIILFVMRRK